MFWVADAGWAREGFLSQMRKRSYEDALSGMNSTAEIVVHILQHAVDTGKIALNGSEAGPMAFALVQNFLSGFGLNFTGIATITPGNETNSTPSQMSSWPQADKSIFSDWSYISNMTPSPSTNRVILDIFEGQLITSVVIIGFILIFLIREWVVQQQPLVNLDQLNNVQQQLREAAERVNDENDRLRRQQELLEQARRKLIELQNETYGTLEGIDSDSAQVKLDFIGWDALEELIDRATEHLRKEGEEERDEFLEGALAVTRQIRAAGAAGVNLDEFTDKVYTKLATYPEPERKEWEAVMMAEIERTGARKKRAEQANNNADDVSNAREDGEGDSEEAQERRPRMPDRDFSSRATQIQRLLEEAEGVFAQRPRETQHGEGDGDMQARSENESASAASTTETISDPSSIADIPITNAGPDAKINIRRGGKGIKAVPEPKEEKAGATTGEALHEDVDEERSPDKKAVKTDGGPSETAMADSTQGNDHSDNPFHPDGPEPQTQPEDTLGTRVASAFREEFGLDEADELEHLRQAGLVRIISSRPPSSIS